MKIRKRGNTIYSQRAQTIVLVIAGIVLLSIGCLNFIFRDGTLTLVITIAFFGLCLLGAAQNHFTKIKLEDSALVLFSLTRKETIEKERITKVTWEAGCGASIQIDNTEWKKIPDMGNSQSLCNSIRAWLKHKAQPVASGQRR